MFSRRSLSPGTDGTATNRRDAGQGHSAGAKSFHRHPQWHSDRTCHAHRRFHRQRNTHGGLPARRRVAAGAVPDLSVDGTIELERLANVVYVAAPLPANRIVRSVFSASNRTERKRTRRGSNGTRVSKRDRVLDGLKPGISHPVRNGEPGSDPDPLALRETTCPNRSSACRR